MSASATLFSLSSPPSAPSSWALLTSEITTLTLQSLPTSSPYSSIVTTPIRGIITSAPSSVAPALCVAACELVGGSKSQAMHAACAMQLMHAATHARARNVKDGGPTSGVELMAEDALLPLGFELVARSSSVLVAEDKVVRVMREMGKVMGTEGVVEGQLLEVEGGGEVEWLWERREGRMAACGAAVGAILGGGSEERVERMRRFGNYVGMMMMMIMFDKRKEMIEVFRSLARLELQGFEEKKVEEVFGFLGLGISSNSKASLESPFKTI